MKKISQLVLAGIVILLLVSTTFALGPKKAIRQFTEAEIDEIEKNLVSGLESEIPSLQASAAMVLKDVKCCVPDEKFSSTVIPLMRLLKDKNEITNVRIAAALALHELKSERGDFAIKRSIRFSNSERVKHICKWLTYMRWLENHPEEQQKTLQVSILE